MPLIFSTRHRFKKFDCVDSDINSGMSTASRSDMKCLARFITTLRKGDLIEDTYNSRRARKMLRTYIQKIVCEPMCFKIHSQHYDDQIVQDYVVLMHS